MLNKVLEYFYQIMRIPRESGNEYKMVEFLKNFALKNNLECVVDNFRNVLIKKQTKNSLPLILQAHTDMVCVCEKDLNFDFAKDAIIPVVEGNILRAKGTSLGADNGVGLCMILSLLEEDFPMNIEAVFTSQEETDMYGASNFDASLLKGKMLLNLDGSKESVIETASASSMELDFKIKTQFEEIKDNLFSIEIDGLIGGHSGQDIDKNRGHAIKILINFLSLLDDVKLVDIDAKVKSNVIPTYAKAVFETKLKREELEKILSKFYSKTSLSICAPRLKIEISEQSKSIHKNSCQNTKELIEFLSKIDYEVIKEDIDGHVLLSANIHDIDLNNNKVYMSVRGASKEIEKPYLLDLQLLANSYNYVYKVLNYLPATTYKEKSKLREILIETHKKIYGKEPKIEKIHAGIETGLFCEKIPSLDANVIAPQIYDLHSTQERVELDSVDRTYEWLKLVVQKV